MGGAGQGLTEKEETRVGGRDGEGREEGSFQNCLADMLILADADNHEQFDELACLCCCGQPHWRKAGRGIVWGGGGGREREKRRRGWRQAKAQGRGGGGGVANMHQNGCHFAFGLPRRPRPLASAD